MPDLTKSRRAVALRIAEAIDAKWPNLNMEGFDIDEATDIIEPLIPLTAAEAEAEMEAMRDDSDDDEAICEPVVNPTLQAFKDAIGCGKVPIIEAIKAATELIHSLREHVTVARESRDAAENAAKESVQAEMAELRKRLADAETKLDQAAHQVEVYRRAMESSEERARLAETKYTVLSIMSQQRMARIQAKLQEIVSTECAEQASTKTE